MIEEAVERVADALGVEAGPELAAGHAALQQMPGGEAAGGHDSAR